MENFEKTETTETLEQKAQRHAEKEKKLREAFRGNANARNQLVKHIIHAHVVDKRAFSEFTLDLQRLFAFPENYFKCETNYNALFLLLDASEDKKLKAMAEKFKNQLKN